MFVMNVSAPNGAQISIPFEDESREAIIKESVIRIIKFMNGELTEEEFDEESLAPEVLAVCTSIN